MKRFSFREAATAAAILALDAAPALAQTAGGLDVQSGATQLATALIVVFGILILVVSGWKGVEAVMDHRSIMPSLLGLIVGITLTFGGAWYMTKMGVGSTGSTLL